MRRHAGRETEGREKMLKLRTENPKLAGTTRGHSRAIGQDKELLHSNVKVFGSALQPWQALHRMAASSRCRVRRA